MAMKMPPLTREGLSKKALRATALDIQELRGRQIAWADGDDSAVELSVRPSGGEWMNVGDSVCEDALPDEFFVLSGATLIDGKLEDFEVVDFTVYASEKSARVGSHEPSRWVPITPTVGQSAKIKAFLEMLNFGQWG